MKFTYTMKAIRVTLRVADGASVTVTDPKSVSAFMKESINPIQEEVNVLLVNNRGNIVDVVKVAMGSGNSAMATPSDVLRPAILNGNSRIILVHNHPSGDVSPSEEDLVFTRRITQAAKLMGIDLLDHVIVAVGDAFYSFRQEGLI
jgi:DNA repair protein RadC